MASKKDTVQITFRAPTEVIRQLDELCAMSGMKRSEFFINAICSEYDKINGNPQLKKMLDQMREIAETMKQMNGQASGSGVTTVTGNGGRARRKVGPPQLRGPATTARPINLIIRKHQGKNYLKGGE